MSDHDPSALLRAARGELRAVETAAAEAGAALSRAMAALDALAAELVQGAIGDQPVPTAPASDHRRAHRPGRPAKLDTDPELRAFVLARIDRLTFDQIAREVALQYPLERRVGRSSIHLWWRKNERRLASGKLRRLTDAPG
jgi:hypothetical protein